MAGFNARKPSLVANRLVFGRWNDNARIYRRLTSSRTTDPASVSSAYHRYPAIAPDGRHITFCSTQSGRPPEVWLAETDGSNARPLAPGCASAWRRDGRMLAVVREEHIWAVDVQGGNLRRVTAGDPIQRWRPSWSGDGQWIYFAKVGRVDGPVGANIWRVPAGGGQEEQVTRNGGLVGFESPDGTSLVYQAALNRSGLPILMLPLTGGPSRQLVACAYGFTVDARGVYYYPCRPNGAPVPLSADRSLDVRLIDPASGRDQLIDTVTEIYYGDIFWGPRVSPNGRTIVYTQLVSRGDDLMLIDNFR
jgi:Tol biopolymer transport system component